MKQPWLIVLALVMCVFAALTHPAYAAAPKLVGTYGYWNAFVANEGKNHVCYMSIAVHGPKADKKTQSKRGDVILMITHRPDENTLDVVSYTAGMKFKPSSEVTIVAGKQTFNLFTQGDTAWSRDAATDHALATAIRHAENLTVNGTALKDKKIADLIHLKGANAAYAAINKACGLPPPQETRSKKTAATASKAPATQTKSAKSAEKSKTATKATTSKPRHIDFP